MKKAIVAAALIMIGVGLAIPLVSGLAMEKTVRGTFDRVNAIYAATGTGYTLEIVDYDRGYWASDIEWKIDLGPFKSVYHIDEIVFSEHATHGFGGVVSATSLAKNPWYADFIAQHLEGRDPLHITTRYGLTGGIATTTVLDAFSVTVDDQTIDVAAGMMRMTTDRKLKHFTSSGSWGGLSAGDTLEIGQATMATELRMLSTFLWDGDMRFEIRHVDARGKAAPVELKNMKVAYVLATSDDQATLSGEARLSIDALHGPDVAVDNASVRLITSGLDTQGYEDFMRLYTQNVAKMMSRMATMEEDSEAAKEAMKREMAAVGFQMMAAYEKILKAGLEIRIADLHANLAEGAVNGDVTLRLLRDMTFMQIVPIINQPELLFDMVYLKSDLSLPASLVGDSPRLLAPLYPGMQTGLLVPSGDRLVHQAETVNGKLVLNGTEVLLPGQGEAQPTSARDGVGVANQL